MRNLKSHPLLKLVNSYLIDSPQPSNISYWWNMGSLLALALGIQIVTGVTLAMHYDPNVLEAFNSVEHIMRDVNNGWLIRYIHSNTASAFFFLVYLHIGRGLYYGSYKAPRTLVWTIGVVIFILMMAIINSWPNWILINYINKDMVVCLSLLPFSRARTRAILRVGPHSKDVLSIIICGMLGDWWADEIKAQALPSTRFNIEQSVNNSAYIHNLSLTLFEYGYCSSFVPKLVKKSEGINDKRIDKTVTRFNYRLTLFTYTSLHWIYEGFYTKVNGVTAKRVPEWIGEYITPIGLAHLLMQAGSVSKEGLMICTQFNNPTDINRIINVLKSRYNIDSAIHSCALRRWDVDPREEEKKLSVLIRKESMPFLRTIINPYMDPTLLHLLGSDNVNSTNTAKAVLSTDKVVPVAIYKNADVQKESAIEENRGKSGVYRWINKENGKSYVGSSVKLNKRFNQYYSYNHISDPARNMLIDKALLKYGYSNFQLEILEHCDPSLVIKREQFYLDLLKPEYNILPKADSSLGHKHLEKTLEKMRKPKTPEHLAKLKKISDQSAAFFVITRSQSKNKRRNG